MGQYWRCVNLDRKESINAHELGSGLKLWEMLANAPGVGAALVILCAAQRERRGGGDLDWDGPGAVPFPPGYQAIAHRTIGRWAGDRVAIVGDYAEDSDLPPEHRASTIYTDGSYADISADVAAVIEHELRGKFSGDGWREWTEFPV